MKNKLNNIFALTLTELLVSVSIMGIVVVGVASVDSSINRLQKRLSTGSFLSLKTSVGMLDITKNVSQMTGHAQFPTPNIGYDEFPVGNPNRFCIREDINASEASNNTPDNYADDRWVCYDQAGHNIRKCNVAAPANCPGTSWVVSTAVNPGGLKMAFVRNSVTPSQILAIDVTITNRINPSAAASPDNPEITLQTRILPLSQGFSSF